MIASATPAKLRDGSWGARCAPGTKVGDVVTITTKAGKSWSATVTKVLDSGDDYTLCVTQGDRAPANTSSTKRWRRKRRYVPCGYPGCSPHYCDECNGEGRYGG